LLEWANSLSHDLPEQFGKTLDLSQSIWQRDKVQEKLESLIADAGGC
jgi:hypothetical protein